MSAHLGTPPGDAGAARVIPCVETHTCGEPTRIVTMLDIPGSTIVEKQAFVRSHLDHVRQALTWLAHWPVKQAGRSKPLGKSRTYRGVFLWLLGWRGVI
jgi:Proline racemase